MKTESLFKQMRILLFYDLPTVTKADRAIFAKFRKNLLKLGFLMIQESIYVKHCFNRDWVERNLLKINSFLPERGDIRIMIVTEKQYQGIILLRGTKSHNDLYNDERSLIVL